MVLCRQLSTLLCAAVLVCILKPSDSQIGAACLPTTECSAIPNSECLNGACECKQGYYADHGSDCRPKKGLTDPCTNNDECQDSSHCDGGHCVAITTTVGTTTVGTTIVNTAGTNNNSHNNTSNGAQSSVFTGDKLLMISMFLLYLLVNRN
ncbi:uncharacterized protein LOC112566371 [Pomacea canaliculata]|uniref:uncharacterized protein LOC112566371 n=1 Tax=Pomacea canaliculata TaxID=400727 RepID=UPI000D738779|nr:uncharacterized protein LOC112566371 [Pomacea canaliculata]